MRKTRGNRCLSLLRHRPIKLQRRLRRCRARWVLLVCHQLFNTRLMFWTTGKQFRLFGGSRGPRPGRLIQEMPVFRTCAESSVFCVCFFFSSSLHSPLRLTRSHPHPGFALSQEMSSVPVFLLSLVVGREETPDTEVLSAANILILWVRPDYSFKGLEIMGSGITWWLPQGPTPGRLSGRDLSYAPVTIGKQGEITSGQ